MNQPSIELVMSEFGAARRNAGGGVFDPRDRLNPTLDSFCRIFPAAKVTLYTDTHMELPSGVDVVRVTPPFDPEAARYGWRAHDYYQAHGLLQSKADIAIAMDSDMRIVSSGFSAITEFARLFGLALPINPRLLLKIDGGVGVDSTYHAETDPTQGLGMAFNLTPIAFSTHHAQARILLSRYCELMEMLPGRGAVHLAQASCELGYAPYALPPQWCACTPRELDSRHIWQEAVVLHVGHADVVPTWERAQQKTGLMSLWNRVKAWQ